MDQLIREIDTIIDEAESRSTKVITFGELVLFSTESGDAWLLDPGDASALCLARDGERQHADIADTGPAYQIAWPARFSIEGESFVVTENSGRVRTIMEYPTEAIEPHCRLALGPHPMPAAKSGAMSARRFASVRVSETLAGRRTLKDNGKTRRQRD
jgi:hypothetical protein